jgi:hypothetical protein
MVRSWPHVDVAPSFQPGVIGIRQFVSCPIEATAQGAEPSGGASLGRCGENCAA